MDDPVQRYLRVCWWQLTNQKTTNTRLDRVTHLRRFAYHRMAVLQLMRHPIVVAAAAVDMDLSDYIPEGTVQLS